MNTVELIQYSLRNAFDILDQVTSDLSQEQADWAPPGIANPIGALYWHAISGVDQVVFGWCRGQAPLDRGGEWRAKVLLASAPEEEEGALAWMRAVRVDLPALREYSRIVASATQDWLASLAPEDLERKMNTPIGELNLAQMLDTFVIWHINAHCGEIAALKGCQGTKGYLF